ncbi:helix-turn-helix domain-containing protein [Azoarcus sp. L1K30]|uniref:helix-turn-helix domain-containing protein n=1 Tax=Azoarcus sp. L1K30 TaxID=2820277 RepID=UPI001B82BA94|nr:helix-turn-helix domain-containing protein [Azoarcus sp. L1K30]MBR0564721.1 helix-turn-helix domain-containing protein [Azoarcus sp. L1K30]
MTRLPDYDLYGSEAKPGWLDTFSFEWIPERSRPNNWEINAHTHNAMMQLLYVCKGGGEALLDSTKWTIDPPCLIVIPALTVHGFRFSREVDGPVVTAPQRPLEALAAIVRPELVSVLRTPAVIPVQASGRHVDALMPLFLALEREAKVYAAGQIAAGSALLIALFVQLQRICEGQASAPGAERSRRAARLEKFRAMVDRDFRTRLPVEKYASELGVSAGQLARICRESLGMSPLDVINARLVHEAQRELMYSTLSVKQIADLLGFADEAYFGRFFKKHAGQTPTEFRVLARHQLADWQ